ncbi:alpha-glucosidase/alpha-galactosidase [Candidatus Bathyarchaeota archaeon]|nr:MAG: alpha-glucosidase/alpha-galactosidase [Candidatus Bathyarchaeota archaeon]
MTSIKLGVIGAGSIAWATTLVRDLCLTESLWGSTITLMDVNTERLKVIHKFAERYASELKADLRFEKTADRREAIRDADFIINTAMAGGHQYYERMRAISERFGYYRGINSVEWNMVSDYHTIWGYYQFKLMMDVAKDIEDLSPDAWLLLLANPVFEGTTLVSRESKVKVIGLCHGHLGCHEIVKTLGLNLEEAETVSIGFNHTIWLTKFQYEGEDAYHLIDEWIEKNSERYWRRWRRRQRSPFDIQMSPAAVDMYRNYGLFPVGDTVRSGTWKYHWNLRTKKHWFGPTGGPDSEIGWSVYLSNHEKWLNRCVRAVQDEETPLRRLLPPKLSRESVVPIINSITNDEKGVYQVNIPNQGAIDGIPDDVVVEVPAEVDGKGIHRIHMGSLPKRVMNHVMYPRMTRMEWALEAYIEGGRNHLFEWLIVDARTKSTRQVERTIDALLSMPENEEMAKHFS